MKFKLAILFILFSLLISCNKNNDVLSIEGKYIPALTGNLTPVIMYTMQGQVTNPAFIKEFLQRNRMINGFIFDSSVISVAPNLISITFLKDNKVTAFSEPLPTAINCEIIERTSSQIVIANMDSSYGYLSPYSPNRCDSLKTTIKSVNSGRVIYRMSPATGYEGGYYNYRPMFPIEINNEKLFLPIMTSMVRSTTGPYGYCSESGYDGYNLFNRNIVGQLRAGDTIVYQINKVQLIKQ